MKKIDDCFSFFFDIILFLCFIFCVINTNCVIFYKVRLGIVSILNRLVLDAIWLACTNFVVWKIFVMKEIVKVGIKHFFMVGKLGPILKYRDDVRCRQIIPRILTEKVVYISTVLSTTCDLPSGKIRFYELYMILSYMILREFLRVRHNLVRVVVWIKHHRAPPSDNDLSNYKIEINHIIVTSQPWWSTGIFLHFSKWTPNSRSFVAAPKNDNLGNGVVFYFWSPNSSVWLIKIDYQWLFRLFFSFSFFPHVLSYYFWGLTNGLWGIDRRLELVLSVDSHILLIFFPSLVFFLPIYLKQFFVFFKFFQFSEKSFGDGVEAACRSK